MEPSLDYQCKVCYNSIVALQNTQTDKPLAPVESGWGYFYFNFSG